jgi:transcription elongation GreA/GreB family factor
MEFKEEIIQRYTIMLKDRIDVFKDMIAALTEDSKNDAKGSAGDKHETALSMMHLEQEKLNHKLQENMQLLRQFSEIDFTKKSERIVVGSLVKANNFYFLVSVALPKISREGYAVFAVSPQAPLASKLLGLKINEEVTVNGTTYLVKEVL